MEHRRTTDSAAEDEPTVGDGARGNGKSVESQEYLAAMTGIRTTDIEPYTGLRYLSKLFRFMAIIVLLIAVAEVATGLYEQGAASIPTLLGEISRLIVVAGVLWGAGDFAHLLIDVGHDVRAQRVLLARQTYHLTRGEVRDRPISVERPVALDRVDNAAAAAGGPPIP